MVDLEEGLEQALLRVNRMRASETGYSPLVEEVVEALFRSSTRLAVYGSFAPGELNHSVIKGVPGSWSDGYVRGELYDRGWAARSGFPSIRLDPSAQRVPVKLLTSRDLVRHWRRLDEFEGDDYRRSLAKVFDDSGLVAVANIYEVPR